MPAGSLSPPEAEGCLKSYLGKETNRHSRKQRGRARRPGNGTARGPGLLRQPGLQGKRTGVLEGADPLPDQRGCPQYLHPNHGLLPPDGRRDALRGAGGPPGKRPPCPGGRPEPSLRPAPPGHGLLRRRAGDRGCPLRGGLHPQEHGRRRQDQRTCPGCCRHTGCQWRPRGRKTENAGPVHRRRPGLPAGRPRPLETGTGPDYRRVFRQALIENAG